MFLMLMKFISWAVALGSGTSGGTLAPLLTIGGGLGATLGAAAGHAFPGVGIDVRVAALVGMAALFAGASRALLASVVFAFETTLQPMALLPLLAGCTAAYLASSLLMRQTIMTEKIARRGVRVPVEYTADLLERIHVMEVASREVVTLCGSDSVDQARAWIAGGGRGTAHQGFPVLDEQGVLVGVLTRRDLLPASVPGGNSLRDRLRRPPVIVYSDCTLRQAVDHMANHDVGRLPVVHRENPGSVIGFITRSDILSAYRRRLKDARRVESNFQFPFRRGSSS
jgi:CBS domain-containing protein